MGCRPNHALQRTRHGVAVGNRCVPWAGSLSLGRWPLSHAQSDQAMEVVSPWRHSRWCPHGFVRPCRRSCGVEQRRRGGHGLLHFLCSRLPCLSSLPASSSDFAPELNGDSGWLFMVPLWLRLPKPIFYPASFWPLAVGSWCFAPLFCMPSSRTFPQVASRMGGALAQRDCCSRGERLSQSDSPLLRGRSSFAQGEPDVGRHVGLLRASLHGAARL